MCARGEVSEKSTESVLQIVVLPREFTKLLDSWPTHPLNCLFTCSFRYDIRIYPTFLHLHGKTFDYKIPYTTVLRLFLLPHKDQRQMFFVVSELLCCFCPFHFGPFSIKNPLKFVPLNALRFMYFPLEASLMCLTRCLFYFCVVIDQSGSSHQAGPDALSLSHSALL